MQDKSKLYVGNLSYEIDDKKLSELFAAVKERGLVDQIIREPLGSAHRDIDETARNIKQALVDALESFEKVGMEKLLETRYQRLTSFGEYLEQDA